jgi:hypothetical protein
MKKSIRSVPRFSKTFCEMTHSERLVGALFLSLTAPTDALADEVSEIAEELARALPGFAVESCKAIALAKYKSLAM